MGEMADSRPTEAQRHSTVVVIPAHDPDRILVGLAKGLAREGYAVVVVDDGSRLELSTLWAELEGVSCVVHHERNRGKGAALKTGIGYGVWLIPEARVFATMDADGQHTLSDLEAVVAAAWKTPGSLVLGTRSFVGDVPRRSRVGNQIARMAFRAVSGLDLADTQTGLRAFDRGLAQEFEAVSGSRFEYETNVLLHCVEVGVSIEEVSIATLYGDGTDSPSHYRSVRDSVRIGWCLASFSLSSLVCFVLDYALYAVLMLLPLGLPVAGAALAARLLSAPVNYMLNRAFVFGGVRSSAASALRYALLACVVLAADCCVTMALMAAFGLGALAARLVAQVTLFFVSFVVQRTLVFPARAMKAGQRA